jgi:hypothetical protein
MPWNEKILQPFQAQTNTLAYFNNVSANEKSFITSTAKVNVSVEYFPATNTLAYFLQHD